MLYKGGSSSLALCHLEMNIEYITLLLSLKGEYAVKDLVYALEGETLSLYLSMYGLTHAVLFVPIASKTSQTELTQLSQDLDVVSIYPV